MRWGLRKRRRPFIFLCLFILPIILHFILKRAEPAFYAQCSNYSNTAFTELVNDCIRDMADSGELKSFFEINSDNVGHIASIEADTARINRVRSQLLINIQNALNADYPAYVYIPAGSLSPYPLLTYYGPALRIKVYPISIVNGKLDDKFESVGINQVRHEISLSVYVDMRYTGYAMNETERITARVPIAETVISGNVPQYYGTGMVEIPH